MTFKLTRRILKSDLEYRFIYLRNHFHLPSFIFAYFDTKLQVVEKRLPDSASVDLLFENVSHNSFSLDKKQPAVYCRN